MSAASAGFHIGDTGAPGVWSWSERVQIKPLIPFFFAHLRIAVTLRFAARLRRLDPRPRHAGIAPIISAMIFRVSIEIFGARRIVLQHRNSANRIDASRKAENHRRSAIADHTRSRLIPAAHRTAAIRTSGSRHARIVSGMETDHARRKQFIVDAFGNRRAAVFFERRGIEDAVSQLRIAALTLDNARADFFGGEFQTFVGTGCAVVFAVSNKDTARE